MSPITYVYVTDRKDMTSIFLSNFLKGWTENLNYGIMKICFRSITREINCSERIERNT